MFNAEKQDSHTGMKSALTESCSLKRAASDREKYLDDMVAKKQKLVQKKKDLNQLFEMLINELLIARDAATNKELEEKLAKP